MAEADSIEARYTKLLEELDSGRENHMIKTMELRLLEQQMVVRSTEATIDQEQSMAIDCLSLEGMNLAYWQQKRLRPSTEATIDLGTARRLEYLSLGGVDLAHLQQQRSVYFSKATIETHNGEVQIEQATTSTADRAHGEDGNQRTKQSSMDQYFPHPLAPDPADRSLLYGQQEHRVSRDSRDRGTRSNEIDNYTTYFVVGNRRETIIMYNSTGTNIDSRVDTHEFQELSTPGTKDSIDLMTTTEDTNVQKIEGKLNKAGATRPSGAPRPVPKVAIPKIQSWKHPNRATSIKSSGTPTTTFQTVVPKIQRSHVHSKTGKATMSSGPLATAAVQIPVSKITSSHEYSKASPNKIQTTKSNNQTYQNPKSTHRESLTPKFCPTEITEEVAPKEPLNVPGIDIAKKLQKQSSAAPKDGDKIKTPVSTPELRMDGTNEPLPVRFRDVQEDTPATVQISDPPKVLSKAARKKANKKQRDAEEKRREREEAELMEAAIALNEKMEKMAAAETLVSESQARKIFSKAWEEPGKKSTLDNKNPENDVGESFSVLLRR